MQQLNNREKYYELRKKFSFLSYESYTVKTVNSTIEITYKFNLADTFFFHPVINIPVKPFFRFNLDSISELNNIVFHIGMIELISYWKAACPQKVIIKPHFLNNEQILWWKNIYFKGLGEFFHINDIIADKDSFMDIEAVDGSKLDRQSFDLYDEIIIPVGGGKDSAVALELLSRFKETNSPMGINPRKAIWSTITNAGYDKEEIIEVHRRIDPELLRLNENGFLNGHTPFSALLAFVSTMTAILTAKKNIALSNESSANEPTIPGTLINHQYSKSYEFEIDFRDYLRKYICDDINYFSFLRPINELQIAKLFSSMPKYFIDFRSCNKGSKNDTWCGECPKCLFTYIILAPYLNDSQLTGIFGKNLLDERKLKNVFDELAGVSTNKPFECIGTIEEVNAALCMKLNKYSNDELPLLLSYYKSLPEYNYYSTKNPSDLEKQFDTNNCLHEHHNNIIIQALCLEI